MERGRHRNTGSEGVRKGKRSMEVEREACREWGREAVGKGEREAWKHGGREGGMEGVRERKGGRLAGRERWEEEVYSTSICKCT